MQNRPRVADRKVDVRLNGCSLPSPSAEAGITESFLLAPFTVGVKLYTKNLGLPFQFSYVNLEKSNFQLFAWIKAKSS